jgi:Tol biopolymer transport system component
MKIFLTFSLLTVLCLLASIPGFSATTELISVNSAGVQTNGESRDFAMTSDARFIVFESYATNLVAGDANLQQDIFLRDRLTGTTERVSLAWDGAESNGGSLRPAISDDGRFVVFVSYASNLVPGTFDGSRQVFLRDRLEGTTELISISPLGEPANAGCDGLTTISADGRFVFFVSYATNLVPDAPEHWQYLYVRDRVTGVTDIASRAADGQPIDAGYYFAITPVARFIVFNNEDDVFPSDLLLRDSQQNTIELISVTITGGHAGGYNRASCISADGGFVAFRSAASDLVLDDTNDDWDVFVRDRNNAVTERASVSNEGIEGDGQSGSSSDPPSISADGRFVAFVSNASNLVYDDDNHWPDGFVRDRLFRKTQLISRELNGEPGQGPSGWSPVISAAGRFVLFGSDSPNLVSSDDNGWPDIFLRDRLSFEDVPLDHWAFYEVGACEMAGIVEGYPEGTYRPEAVVTRDQMAVYLARALTENSVPPGPVEATFPDVPTDYWAYDEIEYAVAHSIVQGYLGGYFQPGWALTRDQMAVFLARALAGEDNAIPNGPRQPHFQDVPVDFWAYKHVEYIAHPDRAITQGYSDGLYHPEYKCTRDQMAVFLTRAFQLPL